MLPLYLGKTKLQNPETYVVNGIQGNCFSKISISTAFTFLNTDKSQVRADITFKLEDPLFTMCTEHFFVGTTFNDNYQWFFFAGTKTISLEYSDSR